MAGSHEVRGSIPLGSTTGSPRGARRRRRAPLFASRDGKRRPGLIGQIVCPTDFGALRPAGSCALPCPPSLEPVSLIQGRRRGPAPPPSLVRPDSPAPFGRPGGKRAPAAHGHREGAGALALASRGGGAGVGMELDAFSALGRLGPAEFGGPIGPKGNGPARRRRQSRESGIQVQRQRWFFANPGIDGLPEALDVRRPLSRKGPWRDDAAIEPALAPSAKARRRKAAGSDPAGGNLENRILDRRNHFLRSIASEASAGRAYLL